MRQTYNIDDPKWSDIVDRDNEIARLARTIRNLVKKGYGDLVTPEDLDRAERAGRSSLKKIGQEERIKRMSKVETGR